MTHYRIGGESGGGGSVMLAGQRSVDVGSSSGMMPKAALPKLKVKAAAVPIISAAVAPWNIKVTLDEENMSGKTT